MRLLVTPCVRWGLVVRVWSGGRPAAMQNSLAGCYHIDNTYLDLAEQLERP